MNVDAIAPKLNNLGRIHIYLLHLFILVDYGYCRREFLAQQPQKAGTRRWDARQVSLDFPLSFYPLSSSSNDNFIAALNLENLEFAIFCKNLLVRSQL
jgi:hypothetical protein